MREKGSWHQHSQKTEAEAFSPIGFYRNYQNGQNRNQHLRLPDYIVQTNLKLLIKDYLESPKFLITFFVAQKFSFFELERKEEEMTDFIAYNYFKGMNLTVISLAKYVCSKIILGNQREIKFLSLQSPIITSSLQLLSPVSNDYLQSPTFTSDLQKYCLFFGSHFSSPGM